MKQLGNLALVCANRKNTALKVSQGVAEVCIGILPNVKLLSVRWDDDEKLLEIIRELNFGTYREE